MDETYWKGPPSPFVSSTAMKAYVLALVILLLLPVLAHKLGLVNSESRFYRLDGSPNINTEIYKKTEAIDLLILGNSFLLAGIDTPYIQAELSRAAGRDVLVRTMVADWPGVDVTYALLKEVLNRRKVKQVFFGLTANSAIPNSPHTNFPKWWRYGEDSSAYEGLSWFHRIQIYAGYVLGSLRAILVSFAMAEQGSGTGTDTEPHLGFVPKEVGFWGRAFEKTQFQPPKFSAHSVIKEWATPGVADGMKTSDSFVIAYKEPPTYQAYFFKLISNLLQESKLPVTFLHVPQFRLHDETKIHELVHWPSYLGIGAPIIGIPGAQLFDGLQKPDIEKLYFNEHMNSNGARYLTQALMPGITEVYQKNATH